MNIDIVMGRAPRDRRVTVDGVDIASALVGPIVLRANPRELTRADVTLLDDGGPTLYRCVVMEVLTGEDALRASRMSVAVEIDDVTSAASTTPDLEPTGVEDFSVEDQRDGGPRPW